MSARVHSLHYPIYIDAGLGRVGVETDHSRYVQSLIVQTLLTGQGERVCREDLGCGLRRMVFAPNSEVSASLTRVSVFQALERWLGSLITTDAVDVRARNEVLEVSIAYTLRATAERRYLNLEVTL